MLANAMSKKTGLSNNVKSIIEKSASLLNTEGEMENKIKLGGVQMSVSLCIMV